MTFVCLQPATSNLPISVRAITPLLRQYRKSDRAGHPIHSALSPDDSFKRRPVEVPSRTTRRTILRVCRRALKRMHTTRENDIFGKHRSSAVGGSPYVSPFRSRLHKFPHSSALSGRPLARRAVRSFRERRRSTMSRSTSVPYWERLAHIKDVSRRPIGH